MGRAAGQGVGAEAGRDEVQEWAAEANRQEPERRSVDRFGQRIDEVADHPAYHQLMALADSFIAWRFDAARGRAWGTLPSGLDLEAIVERARPNT